MIKFRLVAVLVMACMLLGGCSAFGKDIFFTFEPGIGSVFKIGEMSCPESEARVYIANSYNVYGKGNAVSLWDLDINTEKLKENVAERILDNLTMVYAMNVYAKEYDISLSDADEEMIDKAASDYMSTLSDKDKEYLDVSQKDIKKMYTHLLLARNVYSSLMASVDDDVSEDEARVMQAYVIKVSDGKALKSVKKDLAAGISIEEIAASYSEDGGDAVSFPRNTYPVAVEDVAFSLDNGETSDVIEEAGSFYVIHCIEKNDATLSEENKIRIIETRKTELIESIIQGQHSKYYSGLDQDKWKELSKKPANEVTTDKFFSTLG